MGCVVGSLKTFFGIGDEFMWKRALERKVMSGETGLCFQFWTNSQEDDIFWELESAIEALSCGTSSTTLLDDTIPEQMDGCEGNIRNPKMDDFDWNSKDGSKGDFEGSNINRNTNESFNLESTGVRLRRHGKLCDAENNKLDDLNKYTFNSQLQENCYRNCSFLEEYRKELMEMSENYKHHFDDVGIEDDPDLMESFSKASKRIKETFILNPLREIKLDDNDKRNDFETVSKYDNISKKLKEDVLLTQESREEIGSSNSKSLFCSDGQKIENIICNYSLSSSENDDDDNTSGGEQDEYSDMWIDYSEMRQNRNAHMQNDDDDGGNENDGGGYADYNDDEIKTVTFNPYDQAEFTVIYDNIHKTHVPNEDITPSTAQPWTGRISAFFRNIMPGTHLPDDRFEDNSSENTKTKRNINGKTQQLNHVRPFDGDSINAGKFINSQSDNDSDCQKHSVAFELGDDPTLDEDTEHSYSGIEFADVDEKMNPDNSPRYASTNVDVFELIDDNKIMESPKIKQKEQCKCPVKDCRVRDCVLCNPNRIKKATDKMCCMSGLWNATKRSFMGFFFVDKKFTRPISIHKAELRGMDISVGHARTVLLAWRQEALGEDGDMTWDPNDFEKYLEKMTVDLHLGRDQELHGPTKAVARYLGLNQTELPKNPNLSRGIRADITVPLKAIKAIFVPIIHLFQKLKRSGLQGFEKFFKTCTMRPKETILYIHGAMAFKFYKMIIDIETACRVDELLQQREKMLKHYKWKHDTLMHVLRIAKDYYSDPSETSRYQWKIMKRQMLSSEHASNTDLRYNISAPPIRWPVFTYTTILVCTFIVMYWSNGVANVGFITREVIGLDIPTFLGHETFFHRGPANPWIGPSAKAIIQSGAVFGPCMYPTIAVFPISINRNMGCCEVPPPILTMATTTVEQCQHLTRGRGNWKGGKACSQLSRRNKTKHILHVLKPCCVGMFGECKLASEKHCKFVEGTFHEDCDSCHQVKCKQDVCATWLTPSPIIFDALTRQKPPITHWQHYRIIIALFMSPGLMHLALLITMEMLLMATLERGIGWHRAALIYVMSAMGGMLIHLTFQPHSLTTGSTAGFMGFVGAVFLELSQAWTLIENPAVELVKLLILLVIFLLMGTLPLISLTSIIGGFFTGAVSGLLLIPYITFGGNLGFWRGRLVLFAIVLWMILFSTLIDIAFFVNPPRPYCNFCTFLDCIPYASYICQEKLS